MTTALPFLCFASRVKGKNRGRAEEGFYPNAQLFRPYEGGTHYVLILLPASSTNQSGTCVFATWLYDLADWGAVVEDNRLILGLHFWFFQIGGRF